MLDFLLNCDVIIVYSYIHITRRKGMFIDVFKNNGTEYLRLAESRRITNSKGKRVASKNNT